MMTNGLQVQLNMFLVKKYSILWVDNETPCWTSFQQVVYDTAKASLGKHQDWFDPNDQILRV